MYISIYLSISSGNSNPPLILQAPFCVQRGPSSCCAKLTCRPSLADQETRAQVSLVSMLLSIVCVCTVWVPLEPCVFRVG